MFISLTEIWTIRTGWVKTRQAQPFWPLRKCSGKPEQWEKKELDFCFPVKRNQINQCYTRMIFVQQAKHKLKEPFQLMLTALCKGLTRLFLQKLR